MVVEEIALLVTTKETKCCERMRLRNVERTGFEPVTSTMPLLRSTN